MSARFAVCLVICAFAAGNLVVTVTAAPARPAAAASVANSKGAGNRSGPSKQIEAEPHHVDVGKLVHASKPSGQAGPQLLVADRAAYYAGKKNPKATPGYAITQPAQGSPSGIRTPQTVSFNQDFPGITSLWDSQNNGIGFVEPPDTQIAVGTTWVLEMVNTMGQVYYKTGAMYPQAVGSFGLDGFFGVSAYWSPTYFGNEQMLPTDPRVLYDPSSGRYYASIVAFNPTNFDSITLLGISDGADPAQGWTIYPMDGEGGPGQVFGPPLLCDQPKLGYTSDKFIIGCNLFDTGATFHGALLMVGNKANGLAGAGMAEDEFGPNINIFGPVPAQNAAGVATGYVVSNLSGLGNAVSALQILTGLPHTTFLQQANLPMSATSVPPAAPQNGSANPIDTGDDRYMSAVVQGGALYTSGAESCTPSGDNAVRSCLRLIEINLSTFAYYQAATAGLVGKYLINPTLGVNSLGDVVFVYSTSSATDYPDVEAAIQPAGDANTFVGGGQLVAGSGPYTATVHSGFTGTRWGDYSSVSVDPSSPSYVFVAGEFSNGPAAGTPPVTWGTQIAELNGHIPQVCYNLTLTPSVPSPQQPGTDITLTGSATCIPPATPDFQFWLNTPGGTWTMVQDYGNGATYDWASHVTLGTYGIQVRVRGTTEIAKAYDSYLTTSYVITATPCSAPTLIATPSSYPQVAGTPVTLTASTTCGAPPALYQFWVRTPDLVWHMIQDYSTSNTDNWTTFDTQIGAYVLQVRVKNTGSLGAYDNYTTIPYSMQLCTAAMLATGASSPYASGAGAITLTGSGSCAGGTQFQFYWFDTTWHLLQAYSGTNTATWNADYRAGNYNLLVEIRPVGSSAAYVTYTTTPFTLSGCGVPTLSPDKTSPQVAGMAVTWTASASCSGTPEFEFWVQTPSGTWSKAQPYAPSNTFAWTANTIGTYHFQVRARNQGANEDLYDNYTMASFTLVLCTAATLATSATSPYASGAGAITLTGSGSCAGGTQFQFYWFDTTWHLLQAYSGTNTATWNADYKAGNYNLLVEIRPVGSSAAYVTYTTTPFTLSGCGVPSLSPDKTSPQVAGTTVTWTASASCSGTPEFEFWVQTPSGTWSKAQPYAPSNTFAWTANTTGTYHFQVRVRNQGATEDLYDNYAMASFTLV